MGRKSYDEKIIEKIGMAELPLIIHKLYKKHLGRYRLIDIGGDCMFRFGKTNVANVSYLATYIHFITIKENVLTIEGNVSWPADLAKHFQFYVSVNGKKQKCDMFDAGFDLKNNNRVYEVRTAFVYKQKITVDDSIYEIKFVYECNGIECYSEKINSMRFAPAADCIKEQYCITDGWMLQIHNNSLVIKRIESEQEVLDRETAFQKEVFETDPIDGEWAVDLRKKYFSELKEKKKPIWMFMDRTDRADDNAEIFFKFMQKHDEVESVFVIDNNSKDYGRLSAIGKTVGLYSEEHYLTALLADYIVSSQCNGVVENPFWDKAEYFRDLYHKPKMVFLQHGVIKDDMSLTLNRYNTNFTGFITSTQGEYKSILEYPYFYSEKEVWCTGLPVFDELEDRAQKIILVMPTWRQELMQQKWNDEKNVMEWIPCMDIKSSSYYKHYYSLLHNQKLQGACKRYGYKIAFKPHPLLEPYISEIADNKNVEWWGKEKSYRDAFAEGSMMITDYSSVAFEFAYLRKPIMYYQFDKKAFFEKHTYRKGYFDYEKNGFGEVEYKEEKLIDDICNYIKTGCELTEKYKARIEYAFGVVENRACEQICEMMWTGGAMSWSD